MGSQEKDNYFAQIIGHTFAIEFRHHAKFAAI